MSTDTTTTTHDTLPAAPMPSAAVRITVIGGPTALVEVGGLRLLTDPTFDPPGEHPIGTRSLWKTEPPARSPEQLGEIDAVLLSHDQHPDNLDDLGRALLGDAPLVVTTPAAHARLGGTTVAPGTWEHVDVPRRDGLGSLRITCVPALHGPPGTEHLTGEVTGFVVTGIGIPTVYVSGDNASLRLVGAIAERFPQIDVALLFAGGARTPLLGDAYLTLSSDMAAAATVLLHRPLVVPLHTDGWMHFTQGAATLPAAFDRAGVGDALRLVRPGESIELARPR